MYGLGLHYLAEFFECSESQIDNLQSMEKILIEAAEISKATIVKSVFHRFSPYGISGIVVVAESHFAIHTWPEHFYAAVDLFSCGDFDYKSALDHIKKEIKAGKHSYSVIKRGLVPGKNERPLPLNLTDIT